MKNYCKLKIVIIFTVAFLLGAIVGETYLYDYFNKEINQIKTDIVKIRGIQSGLNLGIQAQYLYAQSWTRYNQAEDILWLHALISVDLKMSEAKLDLFKGVTSFILRDEHTIKNENLVRLCNSTVIYSHVMERAKQLGIDEKIAQNLLPNTNYIRSTLE